MLLGLLSGLILVAGQLIGGSTGLTIALVMGLEMINSAIENLVDLVTRDYHPLAGKVKDIAAGAVLIAAVLAVVIGVIVFGRYF